jgi:hypothetical protein
MTKPTALHWSIAMTCFALGAVAACSSDPTMDSNLRGTGSGNATGSSDVVGTGKASGGGGGAPATTASGLPCDVNKILEGRCQTCHGSSTQFGASAPLVTHDDLVKNGPGASSAKKVYELVAARIHDASRPMPPTPNPLLDAADTATLDAWIAAGAPASSDRCTSEKADDGVKPLSCTPDVTLKAATKYAMPQGTVDQYVCVGIDVNLTTKRHITALAPRLDNKTILHHILLFQSPQTESATPTPCAAFGSASWKLVAGWAPGGNNLELPAEAGFPEEKGTTHWVVQLHYNNAKNLAGQLDNSGYDLCTTENLRPNDAGVVAFGSTKFSIPPRSTTTVKCDYTLPKTFKDVKLFNASPHMHTRGTAMSTERLAGGTGAPSTIFANPNFSFENQANFPIKAEVAPGDVMRTRCTWKNAGDTAIAFGENTGDEMCFDFIGYYPNIPDKTIFGLPLFTWVTPSQSATCVTE